MLRRATRRTPWVRFLGASLAVLLTAGQGPGVTVFASEPEAVPSSGAALSVASDPAGASVYVNGALAGATPITVEGVPAGDHRLRLVKDGYLENSRVVSVKPGQGERVQVRMTPSGETRHAVQQDPDTGGGGGGSKVLWIALGVAAVGAGAYFLLKDSNEAPSAGSINANPPVGLAGATSISFSAAGASDPDGDTLTYSWNFGDGATGSGQNATHTYANAGSFNVSLTVSDGDAQATANGSVTVRSLSGGWSGTIAAGGGVPTEVNLTQTNTSLSGTLTFPTAPANVRNWTLSGSVSGPLAVTFTATRSGFQPFTFNGTADADVNRLTGNVTGSGFTGQSWTLTRQ